jgi:2-methylcitrate dehydratase PrpD
MADNQTLLERIAEYATGLRYEDILPEAIQIARWLVFDSIGTGLGGYQYDLGRKAARFAAEEMPGDQATLIGDGRRSTVDGAAFGNATMIKILGMDDSHRQASHIASQVIPASLALAEANHISGKQLIVAIVAAYDLAVRLGRAVRGAQRKRGLDVKGTVGSIAAAFAGGLCAGLDEERLVHAMALAADMSSGTEQYVYDRGKCDTKDLISGFAARNGVFATRLAASDFYGPRGGLDGEYGFFRAFGEGYDPAHFADLGDSFAITSTAFKPHGGCRHTHQAIDAVQAILHDRQVDPQEIERVTISTYKYATEPTFRVDADPPSRAVAGLSIRVATAIALVRGSAWPTDFEIWDSPDVRRLRHITDVEVDPEVESVYPARNGGRVTLRLRDGETVEGVVPYAKGEPEFRMSEEELKEKFDALSRDILPQHTRDEIFARCLALEEIDDVAYLMALTTAQPDPSLAEFALYATAD